jgi:hypothetical protein
MKTISFVFVEFSKFCFAFNLKSRTKLPSDRKVSHRLNWQLRRMLAELDSLSGRSIHTTAGSIRVAFSSVFAAFSDKLIEAFHIAHKHCRTNSCLDHFKDISSRRELFSIIFCAKAEKRSHELRKQREHAKQESEIAAMRSN